MATVKSYTMTAAEARKNLGMVIAAWCDMSALGRLKEGGVILGKTIDDFAAAVRAEALAPATRGQSAELAEAERLMRSVPCYPMEINLDVVVDELDRLRASLAAAEAEKMSLDAQLAETQRQLDGMRLEYRDLQKVNAELRKLCGRAAGSVAEWAKGDTYALARMCDELESAARRAGK